LTSEDSPSSTTEIIGTGANATSGTSTGSDIVQTSSLTAGRVMYDDAGSAIPTATGAPTTTIDGIDTTSNGTEASSTSTLTPSQVMYDDAGLAISTATGAPSTTVGGNATTSNGTEVSATSTLTSSQVVYDDAGSAISTVAANTTATDTTNGTVSGTATTTASLGAFSPMSMSIVAAGQVVYGTAGEVISTATANTMIAGSISTAVNDTFLGEGPTGTANYTGPAPTGNVTSDSSSLIEATGIANGTLPVDGAPASATWFNISSTAVAFQSNGSEISSAFANASLTEVQAAQTGLVNGTAFPQPTWTIPNDSMTANGTIDPTDPALQFHSPPAPTTSPLPTGATSLNDTVPLPLNGTTSGSSTGDPVLAPSWSFSSSVPLSSFPTSTQDSGFYTWSSQASAHQDSIGSDIATSAAPTSTAGTSAGEEIASSSSGESVLE
jgi:hypothetical protein